MIDNYTFDQYFEETYGMKIWNSPLELYNKAKAEYRTLRREDIAKALKAMDVNDIYTAYGVDCNTFEQLVSEGVDWAVSAKDNEYVNDGWLIKTGEDTYEQASYSSNIPVMNTEEAVEFILYNERTTITNPADIEQYLIDNGYFDEEED